MRTVTDHKSLGWIGAWPCAGAERVIARNVGNTVQIYGPGTTAMRFIGGVQPMPADMAIGVFELTLTNVIVGSALQVEAQDGSASIYNGTAATSSVTLSLPCYASVSPLSSLRIKVRKGSASPYYIPWETVTTAVVGSQTIYVAQIPDE